jgi:CRISPR/Cas system CSM-associated protein Csm5 (group 7 of RAMP superfamily)
MKITLEVLKELVIANTNIKPEIKNIYIDFGSGWMDTTLVAPETKEHGSYQMIAPMVLQKIKKGTFTITDAQAFINEINNRGW